MTGKIQAMDKREMQRNIVNAKLLEAAANWDQSQFNLCLQKGADINAQNAAGRNALMLAILRYPGATGWAADIISKDIDLLATDKDSKTAFDLADEIENLDHRKKMVALLLRSLPDRVHEAPQVVMPDLDVTDKETVFTPPLRGGQKKKLSGGKGLIL